MAAEDGAAVEMPEKADLCRNGDPGELEIGNNLEKREPLVFAAGGSEAALVNDLPRVAGADNSLVVPNARIPPEGKVEATPEMRVVANGNSGIRMEEYEDDLPVSLESDGVPILPHWQAKPCVHITGLGGAVKEVDLLPSLTPHGKIWSFVFENERRDAAIVRYEFSGADSEDMVTKVREGISSKTITGRSSIVVEAFRPDSLLFIGNLTPEIDDAILRQMFEPHGTIERAFVLKNAAGRSKGYGFVEYSLKSQASAAKVAMGNINMDGRVLRVEWSDCRKISDMFSTVLFVDRISKDSSHIEQTLRSIFGKYGRVRGCHLAFGINQQLRGFGFLDFYHSTFADKAREALDGKEVEGSNIRVSFANPSKSAQSYKTRFGAQAAAQVSTTHLRGTFQDQAIRPVAPMLGASIRSHTGVPGLGNRFTGQGRSNILGMSLGMQFGRGVAVGPGVIGQNLVPPLLASGGGMRGPGSVAAGIVARSPGMTVGHSGHRGVMAGGYPHQTSRLLVARGPVALNSTAIAQVATAQAKLREEEAKARAAAQSKQSQGSAEQSAAEHERLEQFRKLAAKQAQLIPHHTYYQQHSPSSTLEQHYKQSASHYTHQQPYQHAPQVQFASQIQYQHLSGVQQAPPSQQPQHSCNFQYYSQPMPQYGQQAKQVQQAQQQQPQQYQSQPQPSAQPQQQQSIEQHPHQQAYYQQLTQQRTQAEVLSQQQYAQYAQQYGQQDAQQYVLQQVQPQQPQQPQQVQQYGQQPAVQHSSAEIPQLQNPTQYSQQDYANYYAQQHPQAQETQAPTASMASTSTGLSVAQVAGDLSQQQQAYAAYHQQRAQEAVAQAGTPATQTSSSATTASGGCLEAQWAAYYAAQAVQQQAQTAATSAIATGSTTSSAYDPQAATCTPHQQPYAATMAYYQQPASVDVGTKRTADEIDCSTQSQAAYGYQQQPISIVTAGFAQHQAANGTATYQQPLPITASNIYQQPASAVASYHQPSGGYHQQSASGISTYQQNSTTSGYATAAASNYQQVAAPSPPAYQPSLNPVVAGYQQSSAAATIFHNQPNQTTILGPVYDYSKRTRY